MKLIVGCSRIFQHYSGIQVYLEPYVMVAYSEPWHKIVEYSEAFDMQNLTHIQNNCIFRILEYSEPWHTYDPMHIQNSVKHLSRVFFRKLLKLTFFQNIPFQTLERDLKTHLYALHLRLPTAFLPNHAQNLFFLS